MSGYKKAKQNGVFTLSLSGRRTLHGILFCLPFVIGFFMFFLGPMVSSIRFSFSTIILEKNQFTLIYVGLKNFREALFADPLYVRTIIESVRSMAIEVPLILIFSMFISMLLNQKFTLRGFMRMIYFLPVIVVSGNVLAILQADHLATSIMNGTQTVGNFGASQQMSPFLSALGLPDEIINAVMPFASEIFDLAWKSGVQILIFLAGLQTVPSSLYECAKVEGATAWESFWKITFPLVSPVILMNIVYSCADYFTTNINPVIRLINRQASDMRFEYAAGLSWMYLIIVMVILAVVYAFVSRKIVYIE